MRKFFNILNIFTIFCVFFSFENTFAQLGFCQGNSGEPIFVEDFGTGTDYGPPLPAGTTTYAFVGFNGPQDGQYTVGSNTFTYGWNMPSDHTPGDTNGKALIVNASFTPGEFYTTSVSGLCENTTYEFSSWLLNILPSSGCSGAGIPVNVSFEIWDITNSNLLASGDTGDIFGSTAPSWQQYGLVFQTLPAQTSVILKMINNGVGGCGNDLAIDDINFNACGDFITITDSNNNVQVEVCENETPFNLTLTATPDFSVYTSHFYQWQESVDGLVWTDIAGQTGQTINLAATASMLYRTKVAEDAINLGNFQCISLSDVFQVTVNQSPDAPISNGDVSFNCNLNEATLSVSVPSDISVNWYDAITNGNLLAQNTTTFIATTDGVFYAEAIDQTTGCVSISRTAVNALASNPNPPIGNGDIGLNCETNQAELIVTVPMGTSVNWYDSINNGNLLQANSLSLTVTDLGTYYAEAIDQATGCVSEFRISINVLAELQTGNCIIPQGISPGVSPGFNDVFDLSSFNVSKLEIYNRYGTLVYLKKNYTNEWFGQSKDGDELPVGTYFYTMEYQNGKRRSAWVYINR
ncbi:MAG: gliding motility-associated C-terminal domain-containing protein [Psychroserpens sp.]|nr:gliding motility-associated C-terminal domain-containing protein [Psychroserpens sp.]